VSRRVSPPARPSALLDELVSETPELLARLDAPPAADTPVPLLPISDIAPDPRQPRRHIRKETLEALAQDIRRVGVLQPVVVRPAPDWNGYLLVFGERRYRAALQAGLTHLPALVRRDLSDTEVLEMQWQENSQREDIDDIDKALHLKRWKETRGFSWTEMADMIHLSRRHLLRMQQMAEMPDAILELVREKQLTPSHLYQIARVDTPQEQQRLAQEAASQRWSVQRLRQAIQQTGAYTGTLPSVPPPPRVSLADTLRERLAACEPLTLEEQRLLNQIAHLTENEGNSSTQ
jgi:ParB family chromosome partitioning protein